MPTLTGRTGAGKSSLTAALFRLVELESGMITLDGVDLGTLGLSDVRGRQNGMFILPQDPAGKSALVLFYHVNVCAQYGVLVI